MITNFNSFDKKLIYSVDKLMPFIDWFNSVYSKRMKEEGWLISYSQGLKVPDNCYTEYINKFGDFWQIQRNDEDAIIEDDLLAEELAKKAGLLVDDYGIVIGYENVSFIKNPEQLDI